FLVANKTDGLDPDQAVVDFYSLGLGEIYPIAASHGRGVLSLLTAPTCARASSGVIPRKIAMRGRLVCHCMSDAPYSSLKCHIAI
ncbi:hypothetical protein MJM95_28730, partial [Salmonella enterica subsp. enterica serovar Anatum]|nr:hypothetical protein [Salmonella enterica subsp. enterica serovar Anatum]